MSDKKVGSAAATAAAGAAKQAVVEVENIDEGEEEARLWEETVVSGSRALPSDIALSESPAAIMAEDEAVFRSCTVVSWRAGEGIVTTGHGLSLVTCPLSHAPLTLSLSLALFPLPVSSLPAPSTTYEERCYRRGFSF